MKIMIFNGLLLFLLFMWTSAETGPETVLTEEIQVYANESRVDIQARKRACENLGGKCIKKKKDCPSRWHLETKPGKPYCSKNHRCCYPGPSCNLVWNYKEERPLIMIRDSKIIVPPVLDIEVSDNPSRIPIGRKLIFACPGKNNQFNHVEGTHTQLHGECISHEQFKVCVNSNPEILDLSQLSCSRKMFPSFIKDNTTSDKKSCDGIGGELYKTGYTYGDYHEFKDLEIEVCFTKNNQTTLCASSNLHGNETDYRNAKKDSQQKMPTVGHCGGGGVSDKCDPGIRRFKSKHVYDWKDAFTTARAMDFTIQRRKPFPVMNGRIPPGPIKFNTVFSNRDRTMTFTQYGTEFCETSVVLTYICVADPPGYFSMAGICGVSVNGIFCQGLFKKDSGHLEQVRCRDTSRSGAFSIFYTHNSSQPIQIASVLS